MNRKLLTYINKFGLSEGYRAFRSLQGKGMVDFPLKGYGRISLRRGTSDANVFDTVLVSEFYHSYAFDKILPGFDPTFIIDAGANIGLSAVYFAAKYRNARLVALEPERGNFEVLERNVAGYGNRISAFRKALWHSETRLSLANPGADNYSFRFGEGEDGDLVDTMTIPGIMKAFGVDRIGILKIDIEGGEKALFEQDCSWLSQVDVLITELHDFTTKGCSKAFYGQMLRQGFSQMLNHENVIMVNDRLLEHLKR